VSNINVTFRELCPKIKEKFQKEEERRKKKEERRKKKKEEERRKKKKEERRKKKEEPARRANLQELDFLQELVKKDQIVPGLLRGFSEEIIYWAQKSIIMSRELGVQISQA
jgi:hypothetical protein